VITREAAQPSYGCTARLVIVVQCSLSSFRVVAGGRKDGS
jgi:hypothetical protein